MTRTKKTCARLRDEVVPRRYVSEQVVSATTVLPQSTPDAHLPETQPQAPLRSTHAPLQPRLYTLAPRILFGDAFDETTDSSSDGAAISDTSSTESADDYTEIISSGERRGVKRSK